MTKHPPPAFDDTGARVGIVARNTLLNLLAHAAPILVGVATIPFIIRGLGAQRFAILSLIWVVFLYLTIFDLGLGRATVKFVADALGRGRGELAVSILTTATAAQAVLGVLALVTLFLLTSYLVQILNVPAALVSETERSLVLLAVSAPVMLVSTTLRGALQAAQRFDLVNLVRVPISVANFVLSLIGAILGWGLFGIVGLLVAAHVVAGVAYNGMCRRVFHGFRLTPRLDRNQLRKLASYGGWITVSDLAGPILVYLDRFLLAASRPIALVPYYTAPFEIVTRLWIIPASLGATLFPALSVAGDHEDQHSLNRLVGRSIKYLLLSVGALAFLLVANASDLLDLWLGPEFAVRSSHVLQILAMGVIINSLAQVFYGVIQACGRPNITAAFHLVELPLYVLLLWTLVEAWGVVGAALAWSVRVSVDALLLIVAAHRLDLIDSTAYAGHGIARAGIAVGLLFVVLASLTILVPPISFRIPLLLAAMSGFAAITWAALIDDQDRDTFRGFLKIQKG